MGLQLRGFSGNLGLATLSGLAISRIAVVTEVKQDRVPDASRISVHLSSDGLTAFVTVMSGPAEGRTEFEAAVAKSGIVVGLDAESSESLISAISDPEFTCKDEIVARGLAAEPGQDARLELSFAQGIQPGHIREDGSFDYHDRELLKPVSCGDCLGTIHPEVPGRSGMTVDGTTVSAPPVKALSVLLLRGVELCADNTIRALRDGVVLYRPGQNLDVVDHHEHQGPVDLHSGNLHMQGSLVVRGEVRRPFSVSATGDVDITGSVESSCVRAGGNLVVRGGVRGGVGGALYADGDITIRHAESAVVHSGGVLSLQESVNCEVVASRVRVAGRFRGGSATAEDQIIVKEAGARHGTDTQLVAGEPLELPISEAQRLIAVQKSKRGAERIGGRSADRTKGGKLGRMRLELDGVNIRRLAERAKRRLELLESAAVQVHLAYPGVCVRIGEAQLTLTEAVKFTRFVLDPESSTLQSKRFTP